MRHVCNARALGSCQHTHTMVILDAYVCCRSLRPHVSVWQRLHVSAGPKTPPAHAVKKQQPQRSRVPIPLRKSALEQPGDTAQDFHQQQASGQRQPQQQGAQQAGPQQPSGQPQAPKRQPKQSVRPEVLQTEKSPKPKGGKKRRGRQRRGAANRFRKRHGNSSGSSDDEAPLPGASRPAARNASRQDAAARDQPGGRAASEDVSLLPPPPLPLPRRRLAGLAAVLKAHDWQPLPAAHAGEQTPAELLVALGLSPPEARQLLQRAAEQSPPGGGGPEATHGFAVISAEQVQRVCGWLSVAGVPVGRLTAMLRANPVALRAQPEKDWLPKVCAAHGLLCGLLAIGAQREHRRVAVYGQQFHAREKSDATTHLLHSAGQVHAAAGPDRHPDRAPDPAPSRVAGGSRPVPLAFNDEHA